MGGNIKNSGASHTSPSQRAGKPRGSNSHNTPHSATITVQGGGPCCCHTVAGSAESQVRNAMHQAMTSCAASSRKSRGKMVPSRVSGVTTRLISGMASALATGETSETCWNMASNAGTKPSVTAHCTLPHSCSQRGRPMRPTLT